MSEIEREAEERAAQKALRVSEEKLRAVIENVPVGISISTPDRRVIEANPALWKMFGYLSREDFLEVPSPRHWYDPNERGERFVQRTVKDGAVKELEAHLARKDGSDFWGSLTSKTYTAADGETWMITATVDITERKRMEEELRGAFEGLSHEKQLTDTIVNSMPGIFYTLDFTGRFVRWNSNFERVTGYGGEELAAMSALELFGGEDRQRVAEAIQEVAEKGDATVEAEILNKAGRGTPYLFTGMRAQIGGVPHLVGMGIDITERRKAESELRIKNQVFEDSIASQSVADKNGVITLVNPAFLRLWGYASTGEAIGKSVGSFFADPADATPVLEALAAHDVWDGDFLARRTDGTTFVSRGYATSLRDAKGELTGYQSTNLDVTRERESEAALRQSEEKLRDTLQNLDDGYYAVTGDGVIIEHNRAFNRILGVDAGCDMRGQKSPDFWRSADDRQAYVKELMASGSVENFEANAQRIDGSEMFVLLSAHVVKDASGRLARIEGTVREITDRKRMEEQLKALNENLERSNQELEQFAYVASHDLQEPLRMVSSFTQLLAQRYEDKLDQDAKEFIGFAVDGANRMQRLIQDLLMYSRVATRGLPPAPLDAHDALGEAVSNLQVAIQEIQALVTNGDLPTVIGDPTQVAQVFQNLVGNAIKFHKPGEPPRVHLSAERSAEQPRFWTFKVEDNGIGIDSRHFERLFVIFQRLHGKQEYPGTGIGLALCKRIVERHGGKIWLESEAGVGTTVFFTLPTAERGKGAQ